MKDVLMVVGAFLLCYVVLATAIGLVVMFTDDNPVLFHFLSSKNINYKSYRAMFVLCLPVFNVLVLGCIGNLIQQIEQDKKKDN